MKVNILLPLFLASLAMTHFASAQDTTGLAISPQKFQRQINKRNAVVIDVRSPEEYQTGFVRQALNYNVMDSVAFERALVSLDKNKKYLLYCQSGRRSGKALVMMKERGFRNVRHLKGGVTEWKGELKKPS